MTQIAVQIPPVIAVQKKHLVTLTAIAVLTGAVRKESVCSVYFLKHSILK
jgi:hypothetical protein